MSPPAAGPDLGPVRWRPEGGWHADTILPAAVPGLSHLVLAPLTGPFRRSGDDGWVTAGVWFPHLYRHDWGGSPVVVLEDGRPLGRPNPCDEGTGGWRHRRDGRIVLTTADGSDPNSNGRHYVLALTALTDWPVPAVQWPAGDAFRRLPDGHPLPRLVNLGLTNKCNLRCAICGSQSHLDATGERRRFVDIDHVRAVAATVFPCVREVELNSYGEPTLHRDFAEIVDLVNRHHCLIKLQTNATLLRPRIIDSLAQSRGTVMLSVDAVGPLFERARHLGRWADVETGVRDLMRRRDPARLKVRLYPTITRTTLPGLTDVLDWAEEVGMDSVNFHSYEPIANGREECPAPDELRAAEARLADWLDRHPGGPDVVVNLKPLKISARGMEPEDFGKMRASPYFSHPLPRGAAYAHPEHACPAPWQHVEIGLGGEVYACCRAQTTALGRADTPEALCRTWFGPDYQALRRSLRRDRLRADVLPACQPCLHAFGVPPRQPRRQHTGVIPLAPPFAADGGHAFRMALPFLQTRQGDSVEMPEQSVWVLHENGRALGPAHCPHADIRSHGMGAFSHWGGQLYFSSSDNSDPNSNGRSYTLQRQPTRRPLLAGVLAGLLRRATGKD